MVWLFKALKALWYPNTELGMTFMWLQILATFVIVSILTILGSMGIKIWPSWFRLVLGGYAFLSAVHTIVFLRYASDK